MDEIEVKVLEVDKEEIRKKLVALGAELIFDGELDAVYYHIPNDKDAFRVRVEGDEAFMDYKVKIENAEAKEMEELRVKISDAETMRKILSLLGYRQRLRLQKHRTSYRLDDARIEIETLKAGYEGVPPFIEIEAPNVGSIRKAAEKLGIKEEQFFRHGTVKLLHKYGKKVE